MPEAPLLKSETKLRIAAVAGTAGLVAVCAAFSLPSILKDGGDQPPAAEPSPATVAVSELDLNCQADPNGRITVTPDPSEGIIQNFNYIVAGGQDKISGGTAETYTKVRVQIMNSAQKPEATRPSNTYIHTDMGADKDRTPFRQEDAQGSVVKELGDSGLYGVVWYGHTKTISVTFGCTEESVKPDLTAAGQN